VVGASQRRSAVRYLQQRYSISERRGCDVTGSHRSTHRYTSIRPPQDALRRRIRELARSRVRYGYRRIHILLKREGIHINKKRVYRLYSEDGLQLRSKRPRRHVTAATRRPPRAKPQAPNVAWSMDFVSDQTASGQRFRALTVVDVFSRECLAIEPGQKLGGADVVNVLSRIAAERSSPKRIYCDNGSEFSSRLVDLWAYANKVVMEFSRPGKPTDNAFIESFNGTLRDECLNVHWFDDLTDAKIKLQAWQREYNESRPHRSLNELSPLQYKARWAERRSETC
jgi:putative transposase